MKTLTPKQDLFCREYIVDLCGAKAAVRAGYSAKSAKHRACMLLAAPEVAGRIELLKAERADRAGVDADRILRELELIALAKPVARVKRGRVTIEDTDRLSDAELRTISELSEGPNGIRVKQHDKVRALELLGKHLGLFPSQVELSGRGGGPVEIAGHLSDEQLEEIIHDPKAG